MGPSGSGKSTLMHCMAGLDDVTAGEVYIGGVELGSLSERDLTQLRRDNVGFVFQAFNLVPTLTAVENMTLPLALANGSKADPDWLRQVVDTVGLGRPTRSPPQRVVGWTAAASRRVASAGQPARDHLRRRADGQPRLDEREPRSSTSCDRAVRELGQTIVMVTHDPIAASYSDRVVFLADGRIVSEMHEPTSDAIIDHLKVLDD